VAGFVPEEGGMSLDNLVILILAIVFFGGVAFLYRKSRQAEQKAGQMPSPAIPTTIAEDSSPKRQEKRQKSSRS
jgi:hypothetical protein